MLSNWESLKLGSLVIFKTGKLNSNAAKPDGIYPFFTCSQETFLTDTYSFDTECVLLAGNNANGIFSIKYFSGKFDAYQRTYVIEPIDKGILNTRFLFYSLQCKLDYMRSVSTGAATKFLTLTILNDIDLKLPPLPTQRRIASILSAYDDLIENNTRRIRLLEAIAQAIYREWFVNFRFPGHEGAAWVDTEKGRLPQGWEMAKLGEIAHEARRNVQPDEIDPATPYFGLEHLPRKSIALSEWGLASEVQSTKLAFKKGEILFGKIRPYFHKVGVAPMDGVCSSDTIVLAPKNSQHFGIVLLCVSSESFVNHATQTSQGTKMPRANWGVLAKYPITVPPEPLLIYFNEMALNIVDLIQNLVFCNRNLRRTRDLLLPKLVSGEVDVSEIAIAGVIEPD